ncbi:MAG: beta-ketoacyl-[acyl-carrier-protein] synthase family protein [Janthinobacterium lividum]
MQPLAITAGTTISAMGRGVDATLDALRTRRSGLRPGDFGGITDGHVGRVDGVETHALPPGLTEYDCRNNRLADMALNTDGFASAVAEARAHYGADRVAVVLGTSTSGILSGEDAYRDRDPDTGRLPAGFDHEHTQDMFSLARYVRAVLELRGPAFVVSTACASASKSFIDAHHLIEAGVCDAAVVGGADSLCRMTMRGFAALELISPSPCRPCDAARTGISIGEAAGFALLERAGARPVGSRSGIRASLLGHGASSDGHHMSSPHPRGEGAILAMRQALDRAGLEPEAIDYINLHGTGTRANDAMEDVAVTELFGRATDCSSTKGWTGHTLGASGIVETVIAALCITHGFKPGCLGVSEVDPTFQSRVLVENRDGPVHRVMSNSFGFGGINCSLIFGPAA